MPVIRLDHYICNIMYHYIFFSKTVSQIHIYLVCCLEHFLFVHILGIIIPTDWYFSEGLKTSTRYRHIHSNPICSSKRRFAALFPLDIVQFSHRQKVALWSFSRQIPRFLLTARRVLAQWTQERCHARARWPVLVRPLVFFQDFLPASSNMAIGNPHGKTQWEMNFQWMIYTMFNGFFSYGNPNVQWCSMGNSTMNGGCSIARMVNLFRLVNCSNLSSFIFCETALGHFGLWGYDPMV